MDVPLDVISATYTTEQGAVLTVYRAFATAGFATRGGPIIRLPCLIDTGAPLSVVPYAVWHRRNLAWSSVSKTLSRAKRTSALDWQGIPCELGFMEIDFFGPRRLVGKFATRPSASADVILGLNFLTDNDLEITLRGSGGSLSGFLSVP